MQKFIDLVTKYKYEITFLALFVIGLLLLIFSKWFFATIVLPFLYAIAKQKNNFKNNPQVQQITKKTKIATKQITTDFNEQINEAQQTKKIQKEHQKLNGANKQQTNQDNLELWIKTGEQDLRKKDG